MSGRQYHQYWRGEETEKMHQVEHHFSKFDRLVCGRIPLGAQVLKRLIEVGVGSPIVFFPKCVKLRLQVQSSVELGYVVDRVCGSALTRNIRGLLRYAIKSRRERHTHFDLGKATKPEVDARSSQSKPA